MNDNLNLAVERLLTKGTEMGEKFIKYDFNSGPNRARCTVVSNPRTDKAGVVYCSDRYNKIDYYLISFNRIKWMETEGWSLKEIVGEYGREIFNRVLGRDLAHHLCMQGN